MTREEHLRWCKDRAIAFLPGDLGQAFTSLVSDLGKHAETEDHPGLLLGTMLLLAGHLSTAHEMRQFIEGFQ